MFRMRVINHGHCLTGAKENWFTQKIPYSPLTSSGWDRSIRTQIHIRRAMRVRNWELRWSMIKNAHTAAADISNSPIFIGSLDRHTHTRVRTHISIHSEYYERANAWKQHANRFLFFLLQTWAHAALVHSPDHWSALTGTSQRATAISFKRAVFCSLPARIYAKCASVRLSTRFA